MAVSLGNLVKAEEQLSNCIKDIKQSLSELKQYTSSILSQFNTTEIVVSPIAILTKWFARFVGIRDEIDHRITGAIKFPSQIAFHSVNRHLNQERTDPSIYKDAKFFTLVSVDGLRDEFKKKKSFVNFGPEQKKVIRRKIVLNCYQLMIS